MLIKPEKILFENINDVIDYITKGFPPTKNNYDKIIFKIMNPDNPQCDDTNDSVSISKDDLKKIDRGALIYTLDRVYQNKINNTKHAAIGIGAGLLLWKSFKFFKNSN